MRLVKELRRLQSIQAHRYDVNVKWDKRITFYIKGIITFGSKLWVQLGLVIRGFGVLGFWGFGVLK